MAPTESSILSNFLLPPASLPQVLTLQEFTALFPRAHQSNPQIELIYREYQHQRAIDTDDVKRNIAVEVQRGEKYQREVTRARRKHDADAMQGIDMGDVMMEAQLFGQSQHHPSRRAHTAESLQTAMETASEYIEAEIAALEKEVEQKLLAIKSTVGDLSDLRYGKFAKPAAGGADLGQDAIESLERLQKICESSGKG